VKEKVSYVQILKLTLHTINMSTHMYQARKAIIEKKTQCPKVWEIIMSLLNIWF